MKKNPRVFINHILESIETVEKYTKNLSKKDFLASREKQDAIIRRIEIIGEAVKNLETEIKQTNLDIPWQDISDMRNKLIHEYFGVDLELVWEVVERDIPILKRELLKVKLP